MSWLSHFTGWMGEKSKTILPIVTGLAGFAAGMIPGIGGTASKMIDSLGNKISGGVESLGQFAGLVDSPASPQSAAVEPIAPRQSVALTVADLGPPGTVAGTAGPRPAPAGAPTSPLVWLGAGLAALLLFSKK